MKTTPQEAFNKVTELYPNRNIAVTNSLFTSQPDSWFLHVEEVVVYAETFEKALHYLLREAPDHHLLFRDFTNAY